ncbi:unnamed protein product [Phytophthora lilii]|uniref:Unnamed protein product n=1 Tax=Phytophthora lilii TaxID=2077276 RepID=A0A9W6UDR4_9STRA|nr:unnamed protein product [Phytophthora lilii]
MSRASDAMRWSPAARTRSDYLSDESSSMPTSISIVMRSSATLGTPFWTTWGTSGGRAAGEGGDDSVGAEGVVGDDIDEVPVLEDVI